MIRQCVLRGRWYGGVSYKNWQLHRGEINFFPLRLYKIIQLLALGIKNNTNTQLVLFCILGWIFHIYTMMRLDAGLRFEQCFSFGSVGLDNSVSGVQYMKS